MFYNNINNSQSNIKTGKIICINEDKKIKIKLIIWILYYQIQLIIQIFLVNQI